MASFGLKVFVLVYQSVVTVLMLMYVVFSLIRHPVVSRRRKRRNVPPACLSDPAHGSHEYVTANNIKFHYVRCGQRNKPLMLFIHGFPEFWYSWRYQMREFSKDYNVVAIDMRGYGDTDKPRGVANYTISLLVQDIVKIVDALGYKKCTLVAHDWGGGIAWCVADTHPEILDHLIVLNCPHLKVMRKIGGLKQLLKSFYMFGFQTPWLPEYMFSMYDYDAFRMMYLGKDGLRNKENMSAETLEAYKYTFGQPGAMTPPINYYRNLFTHKLPKRVSQKIAVPTLIIWGDDDAALNKTLPDAHTIVCSNLTVKHIPNCTHFSQQDCPDTVNEHMRDFLSDTAEN